MEGAREKTRKQARQLCSACEYTLLLSWVSLPPPPLFFPPFISGRKSRAGVEWIRKCSELFPLFLMWRSNVTIAMHPSLALSPPLPLPTSTPTHSVYIAYARNIVGVWREGGREGTMIWTMILKAWSHGWHQLSSLPTPSLVLHILYGCWYDGV